MPGFGLFEALYRARQGSMFCRAATCATIHDEPARNGSNSCPAFS
jgi:hypothetical protein